MNAQTKTPELAELVVIEEENALATFCDKAKLDPILAKVRAHIDAFEGDASTASGRKQILAMTTAVVKSKSALKAIGERLAREAKELPKKIDAGRRHVEDTLDAWRDEVRKPLTDWESAEDARIKRHETELNELKAIKDSPAGDAAQIKWQIAAVDTYSAGPDREEFQDGFRLAKIAALESLAEKLAWREKYDAEQAELAKLRAAAAAREAEEADRRRIAVEAEAKAEAERVAVERERVAVDNARIAAERQAQAEREAAEKREADLKAQAEASERRAAEAEQRARAEVLAEAKRQEDAAKAEVAAREADRDHRKRINRFVIDALVNTGISEAQALAVLTAIVKSEVPHVRISY